MSATTHSAVFDVKPYDRTYLTQATGSERLTWSFHEFRLSAETASAAKGAQAEGAPGP